MKDNKNKRQPINIRDDFWLVTAQKKNLVEKYFKVPIDFNLISIDKKLNFHQNESKF